MSDNITRAISLTTKNKENYQIHPSQQRNIKEANVGPNFTHPIHQYNNIGVAHLKMKKYSLALSYFQSVIN